MKKSDAALIPALQPGIEIVKIEIVPLSDPALQTTVIASDYLALFNVEIDERMITDKIDHLLSPKIQFFVNAGDKSYDLRQLIQKCHFSNIRQ